MTQATRERLYNHYKEIGNKEALANLLQAHPELEGKAPATKPKRPNYAKR